MSSLEFVLFLILGLDCCFLGCLVQKRIVNRWGGWCVLARLDVFKFRLNYPYSSVRSSMKVPPISSTRVFTSKYVLQNLFISYSLEIKYFKNTLFSSSSTSNMKTVESLL